MKQSQFDLNEPIMTQVARRLLREPIWSAAPERSGGGVWIGFVEARLWFIQSGVALALAAALQNGCMNDA